MSCYMVKNCLSSPKTQCSEVAFISEDFVSPTLHQITFGIPKREMSGKNSIHVFHINGTRMKHMGICRLTMGDFLVGVISG